MIKHLPANAGDVGSIPGLGRSPGEGHLTPVIVPGKLHGQRSLVGYSPWGHESWTRSGTEHTHFSKAFKRKTQMKIFLYLFKNRILQLIIV